jgi:hypothetical protein
LLKSLIQSPYDALAANTWMTIEAASVRLAGDIGLATVLGDSEEGLSIQEIADKTGVDGAKLGLLVPNASNYFSANPSCRACC